MLKIDHISKTFAPGTVNEKRALNDLSLQSYWPVYQPNGKILGA